MKINGKPLDDFLLECPIINSWKCTNLCQNSWNCFLMLFIVRTGEQLFHLFFAVWRMICTNLHTWRDILRVTLMTPWVGESFSRWVSQWVRGKVAYKDATHLKSKFNIFNSIHRYYLWQVKQSYGSISITDLLLSDNLSYTCILGSSRHTCRTVSHQNGIKIVSPPLRVSPC